jgi:hypothetical protein
MVVGLVLTACSGDDGSGTDVGPTGSSLAASAPAPVVSSAISAAAATSDCVETDVEYLAGSSATPLEVVSTAAVSLSGGAAYTVYLADFEIDPSAITLFDKPEVPQGGRLVTLAVTVFNPDDEPPPIEPGAELVHDLTDFGTLTFVVTEETPTELFGDNSGGQGTMTITAVGDTFCAEVDYRDDEKSLVGTIAATATSL